MTRRDRCHQTSVRIRRLTKAQAARAWFRLADHLEKMGDKDIPKFRDLLSAIRVSAMVVLMRDRLEEEIQS